MLDCYNLYADGFKAPLLFIKHDILFEVKTNLGKRLVSKLEDHEVAPRRNVGLFLHYDRHVWVTEGHMKILGEVTDNGAWANM